MTSRIRNSLRVLFRRPWPAGAAVLFFIVSLGLVVFATGGGFGGFGKKNAVAEAPPPSVVAEAKASSTAPRVDEIAGASARAEGSANITPTTPTPDPDAAVADYSPPRPAAKAQDTLKPPAWFDWPSELPSPEIGAEAEETLFLADGRVMSGRVEKTGEGYWLNRGNSRMLIDAARVTRHAQGDPRRRELRRAVELVYPPNPQAAAAMVEALRIQVGSMAASPALDGIAGAYSRALRLELSFALAGLAQDARERQLPDEARSLYECAARINPRQADWWRRAGYVRHAGEWLPAAEARRRSGRVLHKGVWITAAEAGRLEEIEGRRAEYRETSMTVAAIRRRFRLEPGHAPEWRLAEALREAGPSMIRILSIQTNWKPAERRLALKALAGMDDAKSRALLGERLARERDDKLIPHLAKAFWRRPDRDATLELLLDRALNSESPRARRRAAEVLAAFADSRAVAALIPWVEHARVAARRPGDSTDSERQRMMSDPNGSADGLEMTASQRAVWPAHEALLRLCDVNLPPVEQRWRDWWEAVAPTLRMVPSNLPAWDDDDLPRPNPLERDQSTYKDGEAGEGTESRIPNPRLLAAAAGLGAEAGTEDENDATPGVPAPATPPGDSGDPAVIVPGELPRELPGFALAAWGLAPGDDMNVAGNAVQARPSAPSASAGKADATDAATAAAALADPSSRRLLVLGPSPGRALRAAPRGTDAGLPTPDEARVEAARLKAERDAEALKKFDLDGFLQARGRGEKPPNPFDSNAPGATAGAAASSPLATFLERSPTAAPAPEEAGDVDMLNLRRASEKLRGGGSSFEVWEGGATDSGGARFGAVRAAADTPPEGPTAEDAALAVYRALSAEIPPTPTQAASAQKPAPIPAPTTESKAGPGLKPGPGSSSMLPRPPPTSTPTRAPAPANTPAPPSPAKNIRAPNSASGTDRSSLLPRPPSSSAPAAPPASTSSPPPPPSPSSPPSPGAGVPAPDSSPKRDSALLPPRPPRF